MPTCTILHVCADDTGCCGSPTLKCGPKSSQPIHLHFLVYVSTPSYEFVPLVKNNSTFSTDIKFKFEFVQQCFCRRYD